MRFIARIAPLVIKPEIKNPSRVEAANDVYSCISAAVEAYRIQGVPVILPPELSSSSPSDIKKVTDIDQLSSFDEKSYSINKWNYYCFDSVSSLIDAEESQEEIRVPSSAMTELKKRNLSASTCQEKIQQENNQ